jgi:hypothetical protein
MILEALATDLKELGGGGLDLSEYAIYRWHVYCS